MALPAEMRALIELLQKFPGIGPKTAERLAYFVLEKLTAETVDDLATALITAKKRLRACAACGVLTGDALCDICNDPSREPELMVVTSNKDVVALEKLGIYHGYYHILQRLLSPLAGTDATDLEIGKLLERIEALQIKKVIIATASTVPGELTAAYLAQVIKAAGSEVYRIGYGIPFGAELEYTDEITLTKALESKTKL